MTTTAQRPTRSSRYTTGAIVLHWAIALLIIVQIAGGLAMVDLLERGSALQFDAYQLHKSLGITVLILTVARIMWRVFNPPPPEPASVNGFEKRISALVHVLFYALMLAIPLSGWLMITVSPIQIETVLFFSQHLPWPHLPGFGGLSSAARAVWESNIIEVHELLAYATAGLLALHIAGALKHQFADGHFIGRMWPFSGTARKAYGRATTLVATLLFAGVIIGAGTLARHDEAATAAAPAPSATPLADLSATPAPADAASTTAAFAPAAEPVPAVTVPTWTVRAQDSTLRFLAKAMGKDAPGAFASWTADIRFDPNALDASSLDVSIDLASATIESSDITNAQLTGVDGFDANSAATARFTASTITPNPAGAGYVASGTLTLRGITRPVDLPFTLDIADGVGRASGTVLIDRTQFNVGTDADAQGGFVGKNVTVTLDLVADRNGDPVPPPPAPAWTVVPAESRVAFTFDFQGKPIDGAIGHFTSEIRFDPDNLEGSSLAVTLDLPTAAVAGTAVSDAQLKGADGFDTAAATSATFAAETITATAEGYAADGTLTLRGKTVPVTLPFTVVIDGDTATANGTATLKRLDFGIGAQNDPAGDWIGTDIAVTVAITARREGGESIAAQ